MQPPPRKVRVTQELKHIHGEQLSRLHVKHQTECDLLEDLRTFSQKRACVERDYAQALHKLANQYLKREWPDSLWEEADRRNMYCVWRAYLEGTIRVTRSKISACDNYKAQVSEPAKTARLQKEQRLRKCVERLTSIQAELQDSVRELSKSRKKYREAESVAQAVREKAELEAKSKPSLFQSRWSLQRGTIKLRAKRNECDSKAARSRNDYLLTLVAANAHHRRYYHIDLDDCLKVLDGRIYEQVKDYLVSLCQTELESYRATHDVFDELLERSAGVLREFHHQTFVQKNGVFQKAADFLYQPVDIDTVTHLLKESGTPEEHGLDKEARKWATRVAREYKSIIRTQRVLEEFGAQESCEQDVPVELEAKMEVARQSLRKAETVKTKAEARLDLLRQAGVGVETWLKSAMNQVMEELENERWNNLSSSHDLSLSGTADLEDEEDSGDVADDSSDVLDDSSSSPSGTLKNYPLTCKVLYSYKASQPDELSMEEQEILEVIDDGDMEDWVKARNRSGRVGYVPEKYLQLPSSNSLLSMLQSLAAPDARSHSSGNSVESELPATSVDVCFAKALYDYAGQTDDELSFPEGAVIRILSRETREDDGFWEGEFNGVVGVFPAVLVEDLAGGAGANGQRDAGGAWVQSQLWGFVLCSGRSSLPLAAPSTRGRSSAAPRKCPPPHQAPAAPPRPSERHPPGTMGTRAPFAVRDKAPRNLPNMQRAHPAPSDLSVLLHPPLPSSTHGGR
ncbi:F-BAR and double SH3 domains protein 2 isoform X2 [Syngnathus scovelli]|uniref:F-BAR and double SH3 domains protein 2 isoform X2 n=1 Tax=Syngnathus scovelli TaxID=161590 RepID=UPI00210F5C61|nr:F-BAR and double SH3 domains protein 2 isoform X2 [Syngnathus scovelli]